MQALGKLREFPNYAKSVKNVTVFRQLGFKVVYIWELVKVQINMSAGVLNLTVFP